MSERFHLGDLLSITTGRLLSPDHMAGVYRICDFVTGQPHMTHQLPRAVRAIEPHLIEHHPWLSDVTVPDGLDTAVDLMTWLTGAVREYGEYHEVEPLPFGAYVGREPIAELVEMVGPDRVIPVVLPDSDGGAS